jgi:hypothetical protein
MKRYPWAVAFKPDRRKYEIIIRIGYQHGKASKHQTRKTIKRLLKREFGRHCEVLHTRKGSAEYGLVDTWQSLDECLSGTVWCFADLMAIDERDKDNE